MKKKKNKQIKVANRKHKIIKSKSKQFLTISENLHFSYAIQVKEFGKINKEHSETIRRLIKRILKSKLYKIHVRIYAYAVFTKKPAQARMGKGKGSRLLCISAPVTPGQIISEFENVLKRNIINKIFSQCLNKLPIFISLIKYMHYK